MFRAPRHLWFAVITSVFFALGCGGSTPTEPTGMYSVIETFAGTGLPAAGEEGLPPTQTHLYSPVDMEFGPDGRAYIVDWQNHRVRRIDHDGLMYTIIGTGELGDATAGQAVDVKFNHPTHVSFDPSGNLILSAWHNSKIMTMNLTTGYIEPTCGNGVRSFDGDGGTALEAIVNLPVSTIWDDAGRMYFMDQANHRVRMVENGVITTIAGNPDPWSDAMGNPYLDSNGRVVQWIGAYGGDGGLAVNAKFNFPLGQAAWPAGKLAIDDADNIYIPDTNNHRVRILEHRLPGSPGLTPSHDEDRYARTLAGTGELGSTGDGGPATQATLKRPGGVAVGPDGNVYIADTFNHAIRKVDKNGIITTVVGQIGTDGYGGDGGHPADALLARPTAVRFDAAGNMYVVDWGNNRIRVIRR